jgi:hypothetical protein
MATATETAIKNPFADEDGNPIDGQEMEYLVWCHENPDAQELTDEEKEWNKSIQSRMKSEQFS